MIKGIFFDVANTLLYKPAVYEKITEVLSEHGFDVDRDELLYKHKLISDLVEFPDQTNEQFYLQFNAQLLLSMGIEATPDLILELFKKCTYLAWEPFGDTEALHSLGVPCGIISNWDLNLRSRLTTHLNTPFTWVLGSMENGFRKPDQRLFLKITEQTGFEPEEILVIGDSIRLDIIPAVKLGMRGILIDRINLFPNTQFERIKSLHDLQAILNP